jgi:oligoendopeptidase F
MTLAETASIFNETLVFYRALDDITDAEEQLYIHEQYLQGVTQVIVDILSRFEFESAVMEHRTSHELSPEEFCRLMTEAQKTTYGDALDSDALHPYMWAVKGHYYRSELGFYNFPYAFGQLFGLGLYDRYEEEPDGFASRYRDLLRETGRESAVTVAAGVGFDIESPSFWKRGIDRIATLVDRFEKLVGP